MRSSSPTGFTLYLLAAAGLWWLAGGFLLLLTPLPAHTDQLGWTPAYWLVLAPLCVMAGLRLRRARCLTPA